MKKTLITLLALGSVAMATDTIISNAGQTATLFKSGGIVVSGESLRSSMIGTGTTREPGNTQYRNSFTYAPGNIGNGDLTSATYSLHFTIDSIAAGTEAQGMTIDFFSLNAGGEPQNAKNGYDVYVSLTLGQTVKASYDDTITTSQGMNKQSAPAYANDGITIDSKSSYYQLKLSDVDWEEGDYILNVEITRASQYQSGCFAGIGNVTLHSQSVPEPTTGTLSLLALTGLCMRKHRK